MGDRWLDYLDKKKKRKKVVNAELKLSEDNDNIKEGNFYKLTKAEFLKETEHDFMLNELGDEKEK